MNSKKIKLLTIVLAMALAISGTCFGETIAEQMKRLEGDPVVCPNCNDPTVIVPPIIYHRKDVHYFMCDKHLTNRGEACIINPQPHTFENGKCTKCKMSEFFDKEPINVNYQIDENGRLVINMDHDAIEKGWIERIVIKFDGQKAIYLRDLGSASHEEIQSELWDIHYKRIEDLATDYTASRENPYAMFRFDKGNEIQIMWKRIALIINPDTDLANQLGTGQHEFQVELWKPLPYINLYDTPNYNNEEMASTESWYKGKTTIDTQFKSTGTSQQVDTAFSDIKIVPRVDNGHLIIDMYHSDFGLESTESVLVATDNGAFAYREGIKSEAVKDGYYKKFDVSGNELQIMDGHIALIINQKTAFAQAIGKNLTNLTIEINNNNVITKTTASVTGIFETVTSNQQLVGIKENTDKESTNTVNTNTVRVTRCNVCNSKTEWFPTETLHINRCTKDISHVFRIEGHRLDANNKCTDCEYVDRREYKSKFVDFNSPHWAWRNVCYMADQGIVKGTYNETDGTYTLNPDEAITAEAFMALLARILGYKGQTVATPEYMPISTTYWSVGMNYIDNNTNLDAKKEMQRVLADNGMNGTDEEIARNYRSNITREKAGYLLALFLESNSRNYSLAYNFEDWNEVESYYKDSQYKLSSYDILRGIEENGKLYIKPDSPITRVQAITLIDRFNSVMEAKVKYN